MGISILTEIRAKHIDNSVWQKVFKETTLLLNAYPFSRTGHDTFGASTRFYLEPSTVIEKLDNHDNLIHEWKVNGDLNSMRTAEAFLLSDNLESYKCDTYSDEDDILITHLNEMYKETTYIFDAKTQGEPYHKYILAIACLLETRFPNDIMVYGDITKEQCINAIEWANTILDTPIDIPARVDYFKLHNRLKNKYSSSELLDSITSLKIDENENEFLELINSEFSQKDMDDYILNKLSHYDAINKIGAQKIIKSAFKLGYSLKSLTNLIFNNSNNNYNKEDFIKCIAKSDILLPDKYKKILEFIEPSKDSPSSINRIMFNTMLDMSLSIRNSNYKISIEEATSIFKIAFPEIDEDFITKNLNEGLNKAIKILDQLEETFDGIKSTYELKEDCISVPEELIYYETGDSIAQHLEEHINNTITFFKEHELINSVKLQFKNSDTKENCLYMFYHLAERKIKPLKERYEYIDSQLSIDDCHILIALFCLQGGENLDGIRKACCYNQDFFDYFKQKLNQ